MSNFIDSSFEYEYEIKRVEPIVAKIKHEMICPVHKRRVRISMYYDEHGIYAEITYCCCPDFAKLVSEALKEIEVFNAVKIKDI